MANLHHPNVLQLYGICTIPPAMVIGAPWAAKKHEGALLLCC